MKLPSKMKKNNTTEINSEYGKLKSAIKKKLKIAELDMSDFYEHIIDIFYPEDVATLIPEMATKQDIDKVFRLLTKNRLWGFGDVSQLTSIAKRFIEGDESVQQMIQDYSSMLNGYKATTKIIDRIRSDEIKERDEDEEEDVKYESFSSKPTKYGRKYRRKLSAKLFKSADEDRLQLAMRSLEYVEKIWNNLCGEFDLSPLAAVLDTIETGCIQVTWLVASQSASKVLNHIGGAVDFLRSKFISNILIEDIIIYSESSGVADQQVRVHLWLVDPLKKGKDQNFGLPRW